MAGEEPPYLSVGTEVSAKYKGAFCEAKVKKVMRCVKCKVTFKTNNLVTVVADDQIRGTLRAGAQVEAKHPEKNTYMEAVINKLLDYSQYTVVFDDADETTLRRTSLCLKSGRHFAESETLDQLPLTHPEHFGTPVMGNKGRNKRRSYLRSPLAQDGDESSDEEVSPKKRESDIGLVVCVEAGDRKNRQKENWFPALTVIPSAQISLTIRPKDEYLVRSFKDGKFSVVSKKEAKEFTKEIGENRKSDGPALKTALEKALTYLEKEELPASWDRERLFGPDETSSEEEESQEESDTETSDDEPSEAKDRFVAQLYKYMDDRGTPINKLPTVGNKDLNLYKLFRTVEKFGGYNRVTNQNMWKEVASKMSLTGQSTVQQLKSAYKRYLHSFEDFYRKLGISMGNSPRSGRMRHRTGRSIMLIRDRDREFKAAVAANKKQQKEKAKSSKDDAASVSDTKTKEAEPAKDEGKSEDNKSNKKNKTTEGLGGDEETNKGSKSEEKKKQTKKEPPPQPDTSSLSAKKGRKKRLEIMKEESVSSDEKSDVEVEEVEEVGPVQDVESDASDIVVGDRVKVKYGRGKQLKVYEAKVRETGNRDGEKQYYVHYTGWNVRYDEWVKPQRIVENLTNKAAARKRKAVSAAARGLARKKAKAEGKQNTPTGSDKSLSVGSTSKKTPQSGGGGTPSRALRSDRNSLTDSPYVNGLEPRRRRRHPSDSSTSDEDDDDDDDDEDMETSDSDEGETEDPLKKEVSSSSRNVRPLTRSERQKGSEEEPPVVKTTTPIAPAAPKASVNKEAPPSKPATKVTTPTSTKKKVESPRGRPPVKKLAATKEPIVVPKRKRKTTESEETEERTTVTKTPPSAKKKKKKPAQLQDESESSDEVTVKVEKDESEEEELVVKPAKKTKVVAAIKREEPEPAPPSAAKKTVVKKKGASPTKSTTANKKKEDANKAKPRASSSPERSSTPIAQEEKEASLIKSSFSDEEETSKTKASEEESVNVSLENESAPVLVAITSPRPHDTSLEQPPAISAEETSKIEPRVTTPRRGEEEDELFEDDAMKREEECPPSPPQPPTFSYVVEYSKEQHKEASQVLAAMAQEMMDETKDESDSELREIISSTQQRIKEFSKRGDAESMSGSELLSSDDERDEPLVPKKVETSQESTVSPPNEQESDTPTPSSTTKELPLPEMVVEVALPLPLPPQEAPITSSLLSDAEDLKELAYLMCKEDVPASPIHEAAAAECTSSAVEALLSIKKDSPPDSPTISTQSSHDRDSLTLSPPRGGAEDDGDSTDRPGEKRVVATSNVKQHRGRASEEIKNKRKSQRRSQGDAIRRKVSHHHGPKGSSDSEESSGGNTESSNSTAATEHKRATVHHAVLSRPSKYHFCDELDPIKYPDSSVRIPILMERMAELRKVYTTIKTELALIDRRRKKLKRKEREMAMSTEKATEVTCS